MIEWVPSTRLGVVKVVAPPVRFSVTRVVVPSLNVTVPVAVAGTVALKVTELPYVEGFAEDEMATDVVAVLMTKFPAEAPVNVA